MSTFRRDIGGLRALSVLSVLLFHFKVSGFSGGFVGVDVFFVISGYLMTQIIVRKMTEEKFSLADFLKARAFRILPALYLMLAALLIGGFLFAAPLDYEFLASSAVSAALFVSNILFWGQSGYFQGASEENWLLHTWSLSVEWQFYMLYPIAMIAACKMGLKNRLPHVIAVALVLSLVVAVILGELRPSIGFYSLPSRCWELLAGGLCIYVKPLQEEVQARILQAVGLLVIVCCVHFFDDIPSYPSLWAALPVLGAVMVLCARWDGALLSNPVSQWIGNISYSLYLWHWPVIAAARYFELEISGVNVVWLFALSFVLAQASYSFVERNMNGRNIRGLKIGTLPVLIGAASIISAAGLWIKERQGLPLRAPEQSRQLLLENGLLSTDWTYPEYCQKNFMRSFKDEATSLAVCSTRSENPENDRGPLFWGDSLVEQLYPALKVIDEGAGKHHFLGMVTSGGCIPVRGLNRTAAGYHCDEFNERAFQLANGSEWRTSTIVLGGSWLRNLLGVDGSGPLVCRVDGDDCRRFSSSHEALSFVQRQLIQDVHEMSKGERKVIIILPFPVQHVDVAKHLTKRLFLGREEPVSISKDQFQSASHPVLQMLMNVSRATGAELWNPVDALCTSDQCKGEEGMVARYRDRYHITTDTALDLAPAIASALSR